MGAMCVLRADGVEFQPNQFLSTSKFLPCAVYTRGTPRLPHKPDGRKHQTSGFHISVSDADWDSLRSQLDDALHFLEQCRQELARLAKFPGVESVTLDFPLVCHLGENCWMQTDTFPAALAKLAGDLGINLAFSIYVSNDEE